MICGTGGSTESRHNRVRDWLANKIRELEGATVFLEREVFPPFVKQKGRMDLIFKDARNPEHAFIDVVMATGWAPNDREAERQMEDPLRSLKQAENAKRAKYGNVMPFAVSDTGTLGHAAKILLSHIAGADPENNFAETYGRMVREVQVIVLEATARGAMASRMTTT